MKNVREIVKILLLSAVTVVVGFFAVSLPFNLFSELSSTAMRAIFIAEIVIYFAIAMLTLISRDNRKARKEKERKRHERHIRQIAEVEETWLNFAA